MSSEQPVTSPDQHQPSFSRRGARFLAIVASMILVAMALYGNHEGRIENIFLFGIAGFMILMIVIDAVLRRKGLRS